VNSQKKSKYFIFMKNKKNIITILVVIAGIVLVNVIAQFYFFRLDLTSEKRYSISENTKDLLRNLDDDVLITIYLDGDLNSGFLRLKKSTEEMLDEFKVYAGRKLAYRFVNPSLAASDKERTAQYDALEAQGLRATVVYDKDSEGKSIQKVIFPWAQIFYKNKKTNVNLLKNISGRSGSENLNISIENLEFELTDAIRNITLKDIPKIAFIEGHGELSEKYTYDISLSLSKYFQVDRGVLGSDPSILNPYKAIVIAKPQTRFSEADKYIIDQYVMNGGRVLWLIDGVRVSMDTLAAYGVSPIMYNDVNLSDQLFRYGIRINPDILIDEQCVYIPVDQAREGDKPDYQPMPWYYFPLLQPSPKHPISKNLTLVRSEFTSTIDFVGNQDNINKTVLLQSSAHSKATQAPTRISLDILAMVADYNIFNQQHLPVAAVLEGTFPSVFANRFKPQEIIGGGEIVTQSKPTRMVVVAGGEVIANDVTGVGANEKPLPLGYDSYMNQEFGNKSFILNTILYLTDDEGWMTLRSRELTLRLLDKLLVNNNKLMLKVTNVVMPVVLLILFAIANMLLRKRRYSLPLKRD
jgi:gliding-associated putative ABC transporter substrate-binding component GldG